MSDKRVSVDVMRADVPLTELLSYMMERHISHVQIPHGGMSTHVALLFDVDSSSKLVANFDRVTPDSIRKANEQHRDVPPKKRGT